MLHMEAVLPSFSAYSYSDPSRHMMEFSGDEKTFIRDTLDWFTDYSGIQFTEVSDSTSTYGDPEGGSSSRLWTHGWRRCLSGFDADIMLVDLPIILLDGSIMGL